MSSIKRSELKNKYVVPKTVHGVELVVEHGLDIGLFTLVRQEHIRPFIDSFYCMSNRDSTALFLHGFFFETGETYSYANKDSFERISLEDFLDISSIEEDDDFFKQVEEWMQNIKFNTKEANQRIDELKRKDPNFMNEKKEIGIETVTRAICQKCKRIIDPQWELYISWKCICNY